MSRSMLQNTSTTLPLRVSNMVIKIIHGYRQHRTTRRYRHRRARRRPLRRLLRHYYLAFRSYQYQTSFLCVNCAVGATFYRSRLHGFHVFVFSRATTPRHTTTSKHYRRKGRNADTKSSTRYHLPNSIFQLRQFGVTKKAHHDRAFYLVYAPTRHTRRHHQTINPTGSDSNHVPFPLQFRSVLLFRHYPFKQRVPKSTTQIIPLDTIKRRRVFNDQNRTMNRRARTIKPLPTVAIQGFRHFQPSVRYDRLVNLYISQFIRHRQPTRHENPGPFHQILFRFHFRPRLRSARTLQTTLPTPNHPKMTFPPRLPSHHFVRPVVPRRHYSYVVTNRLSQGVAYPATVSKVRPRPVRFRLHARPRVRQVFLFRLLFLNSNRNTTTFTIFNRTPFFRVNPRFFLQRLRHGIRSRSLSAPMSHQSTPLMPVPFGFTIRTRFLTKIIFLLYSPRVFPGTSLPTTIFISRNDYPLPFFSVLAPFRQPHGFFTGFYQFPTTYPCAGNNNYTVVELGGQFNATGP